MYLPTDVEQLIFRFAGTHYPWKYMRKLDAATLTSQHRLQRQVEDVFGPYAWSPTHCNVLHWSWFNPSRRLLMGYSATTSMTPRRKDCVTAWRNDVGYAPIYPGDRQYPTSRVRFDPKHNINDRYFR